MLRISDVEPTTALDGLFTNGKVANGIPPTRLVAEWFNAIQTELINVVEDAGIEINPEDNDQVLKAIKIITQEMLPRIPVTSVNNKTGAVTLGASDVNAFPSNGGTVGSDGVTTPGLLVNGSNLPINGQGVHLAWNESGSNGEGNLICNKGSGQGGFVLRTVNVDNTTETGRVTISGNGDLNTSRYLSEAGQRVYSPNNPPPNTMDYFTSANTGAGWWKDKHTGMIVQFGLASKAGDSYVGGISLPITFPNRCVSITANPAINVPSEQSSRNIQIHDVTNSGFQYTTGLVENNIYWMAMGY